MIERNCPTRTFAQKPNATQQATSVRSTTPGRALYGHSREVSSVLSKPTIGNQDVPWLLQAKTEGIDASSAGNMSSGFRHDFGRIQVHASGHSIIQPKLRVGAPVDSYEQEADRGAVQAMPEPQEREQPEEKQLQLKGVGYRAKAQGNTLDLTIGYSHPVKYKLPEGVVAETPSQTLVLIKGMDKQKVGQVAAEIRDFRPAEPYKGKGIQYVGERVYRKDAKKK